MGSGMGWKTNLVAGSTEPCQRLWVMERDSGNDTKFDFSDIVTLVKDGQMDQAISILDSALEDFKIVGELLNVRALIHQLQNQPDHALATFKAALLVNDSNPEFAKNLFNCYLQFFFNHIINIIEIEF